MWIWMRMEGYDAIIRGAAMVVIRSNISSLSVAAAQCRCRCRCSCEEENHSMTQAYELWASNKNKSMQMQKELIKLILQAERQGWEYQVETPHEPKIPPKNYGQLPFLVLSF